MLEFRDRVAWRQPSLDVELLLMYLDGHVQIVGESTRAASGVRH